MCISIINLVCTRNPIGAEELFETTILKLDSASLKPVIK